MTKLTVDKYDYDKLQDENQRLREQCEQYFSYMHTLKCAAEGNRRARAIIDRLTAKDYEASQEAVRAALSSNEDAEKEESYDCPIHGLMKGETDCPRC